jgi:hypothetical protein
VNVLLEREPIDHIMIFSSPMAEYVRHVSSITKIMDFVDMDSEKRRAYGQIKSFPLSVLYNLETDRLGQYELEVGKVCEESLVISQEESYLLRERSKQKVGPKVIRNGIDFKYFPSPFDTQNIKSIIAFNAALDYFPNIDGALFSVRKFFHEFIK